MGFLTAVFFVALAVDDNAAPLILRATLLFAPAFEGVAFAGLPAAFPGIFFATIWCPYCVAENPGYQSKL
jgi:thiol-disulfide isomerase/thioredoxin